MKKILVVAKWEYFEKVKSKAFIISLFLMPVIMVTFAILPGLLANQEDKNTKAIGVIDLSGEVASIFTQRMQDRYKLPDGQPRYIIQVIATGKHVNLEEALHQGDEKVVTDEIEGYCIIGATLSDSLVEYRSKNVGDFRISNRIEENVRQILTEKRIAALGLDPVLLKDLKVPLNVRPVKLSKSGEAEGGGFEQVFFTAYIFLMMLFFLINTSGQLLVRSMLEEKGNRIVEVLVSSCSPTELMAGKVLGLSGLGFTQIGFWALIGLAATLQFGVTLVPVSHALLLVIYFVLGYLFYAAIFIALGSPVTTEQEAQQINSYLVLVLILPLVIAFPAMQNPNAGWIRILTYFPLLTPTMMALRIPIQTPSVWEILSTIILMSVCIVGGMRVAGKIFRVAILSTGKRPGFAEMLRWVKTG